MKYNTYIKENILFLQLEGDLIGESNGLELMDLVSEKLNEKSIDKIIFQLKNITSL